MTYQIAGIFFPDMARQVLEEWKMQGDRVIIQTMTASATKIPRCNNCNDLGAVHIQLLRGKYDSPPASTSKAITWVEGAWRVIDKVQGFICPVCAGKGASAARPSVAPQQVQDAVEGLVEDWTDH